MSGRLPYQLEKATCNTHPGKGVLKNHLRIRGKTIRFCLPVASGCIKRLQDTLMFGEILKVHLPSCVVKAIQWPRKENLGMVKMMCMSQQDKMDNPQAYDLNSHLLEHGQVTETERVSVSNEGLAILNSLKIQSGPLGKLKGLTDGWSRFNE
jgi:hypothetical protein